MWVLDAYILPRYPLMGVSPVLLPLAVAAVAVLEGAYAGTGFGLAVGLLWELAQVVQRRPHGGDDNRQQQHQGPHPAVKLFGIHIPEPEEAAPAKEPGLLDRIKGFLKGRSRIISLRASSMTLVSRRT
mgnify:CR=1 FL=1